MKKKLFTLIEILVVVLIIGIIIGSLIFLSWNYVRKLKFRFDIEKFETLYMQMYSNTLGFFGYNGSYYKTGGIYVRKGSGYIDSLIFSGSDKFRLKRVFFKNTKIKEILINNIGVDSGVILFKSYKFSVWFKTNNILYKTGVLKLVFGSNGLTGHVIINLDIGKIY